jgi:hypothetical protein
MNVAPMAAPSKRSKSKSPASAPSHGRRATPVAALGDRGYVAGGRPPAPDLAHVAPVRLTAYLAPAQLQALRAEVRRRQAQGQRADVSMVLRELIDAAYPGSGRG